MFKFLLIPIFVVSNFFGGIVAPKVMDKSVYEFPSHKAVIQSVPVVLGETTVIPTPLPVLPSKPKPVLKSVATPSVTVTPVPITTPSPTIIAVDFCSNISGNQLSVPSGMQIDSQGNCFVIITPTPLPTLAPVYIYLPQLTPVPTPTPTPIPSVNPAQIYIDCENAWQKANQEVLAGFSNGGIITQSQINGLTKNQMAKDGFGYCIYLY